ncbi:MAG: SRPBCC domain-containing protein [Pseudomonadota bacterium]|nr:SRPBCC domain-containing protein [Pseudomonadota bacterium]
MIPGDRVRVTVAVAVTPEIAFEIFTREIDLWWRRGPRFRHFTGDHALIAIEPCEGGRVFEQAGADGPAQESGRVLVWQPPARLVFQWRIANFTQGEHTQVEVLFEAAAGGTAVTVTHSGWAAIRSDHPVRHGRQVTEFIDQTGRWWGSLLTSFRGYNQGTR